ncbi:MAG: LytTR family transcriptional regulator [Lachnospiraceae bacterium]|jgi:DNA-binding LytR/AlgR family response regulator|nr:LytTR family transcriptional regulator [Lachnospiraceae bacterium]
MKIRFEIDSGLAEDEIVIKCRSMDDDTLALGKRISDAACQNMQLKVLKDGREYYLELGNILFLETMDTSLAVHTAKEMFTTKEKLYALEEILPGYFMRVSKSTIVNIHKIRSIKKNITGASDIEFAGSSKSAYASRNYIKLLLDRLDEKRLKKNE